MVLATILLACATWPWLANNSEKMKNHSFRNSVKAIVCLFITMTLFLLITYKDLQQQLYQHCHKFLELPTQEKLVMGLIVSFVYLAKTVRSWIIKTYSITVYYVLVIGVRAVLLWYAVDPHIFLSVEVASVILAIPATRILHGKKERYLDLEWGKQLVEVIFYTQLVMGVARLLLVVYSQPTPSLWVCTTILVVLFEAALCLGKVLVEMVPPDGILWGDFSAAVSKIRRLVSPDRMLAFQGGEEWSHEEPPKKEVPDANTSRMMPANQGQGVGGGGPLPRDPILERQVAKLHRRERKEWPRCNDAPARIPAPAV